MFSAISVGDDNTGLKGKILSGKLPRRQQKLVQAWMILHEEELKEKDNFQRVKVEGLSIEWENGADICPDELYENSKKINIAD